LTHLAGKHFAGYYQPVTPEDAMSTAESVECGRVVDRVYSILKTYNAGADIGWVFPADTSFRCFPADPGRVERPDAAFISFARMPSAVFADEGHCPTVPDVVVEVVAPHDLAVPHMDKVMAWLTAGTRLVWEVFPKTRAVTVMRPDGSGLRLRRGDILSGEDVLPGFAVPVADLFLLPAEPAPAATPPV
jgi:Uma2 family endonuclease